MDAPTYYTLTRTPYQGDPGEPPIQPEVLETYVDSLEGEPWTGGYLKHEIGDQQIVNPHVARVVMSDPGLRKHYRCDPPIAIGPVETSAAHEVGAVVAEDEHQTHG